MINENQLESVIDEFVQGEGYIDVVGKVYDDYYTLEITDGYNHTWFYTDVHLSELDTLEDLYIHLYQEVYNYDPADELELLVKTDISGKPDFRILIDIYQDVDKTVRYLQEYLFNAYGCD